MLEFILIALAILGYFINLIIAGLTIFPVLIGSFLNNTFLEFLKDIGKFIPYLVFPFGTIYFVFKMLKEFIKNENGNKIF